MVSAGSPSSSYAAITDGAALVDRSERGKLALVGSEAKAALNGVVSNDVAVLEPGHGLYAAVLTPKGKMLGDLRVLDHGGELALDMERAALQPVFDVLRACLVGFDATLEKRTLQRGLLSLLGPASRTVSGALDLPYLEHDHAPGEIGGQAVVLVATDLGVDVLCGSDAIEAVSAALMAAGAVGSDAATAEIARVESGRPRYGVDLDDSVIPQEAGLNDRAVSFTKGCYVGQETVARLFYRGKPNRHLRGLRLSEPAPAGAELTLADRGVGTLTSSVVSPRYGPIGLALIRREAEPETIVQLASGVTAHVVALPFEGR